MSPVSNSLLAGVRTYVIAETTLQATVAKLAELSDRCREAFVVWGGKLDQREPTRLNITSALVPAQTATSSERGLLVTVHGDALFAVNRRLYERGELLVGQIHTHPGAAYHSDTDNDFPLVTLVGGLSLVIHDFARHQMRQQDRWAWYRLRAMGDWAPLAPDTSVEIC